MQQQHNKKVTGKSLLALLGFSFLALFFAGCNSNTNSSVSQYGDYIKQNEKNITQLPPDRKGARDTLYSRLKVTSTYKTLVENKTVSTEYIPVLTAIAEGISSGSSRGFTMSDEFHKHVEESANGEDKLEFTLTAIGLGLPQNGGFPVDIIEVFERYKEAYKIYGDKGYFIGAEDGKQSEIKYAYDFAPFFGLIAPKDEDVLNSVYEAKQKGFSSWQNTEDAFYPYLASRAGYTAYVKKVYPESPYILKVDYEISAYDLYNEYNANEVSADENYKGKKLAVTGVVGDITKDAFDNAIVHFKIDFLQTVSCNFGDNTKAVSQLGKGEQITVIGKCKGFFMQQVLLEDCEIYQ